MVQATSLQDWLQQLSADIGIFTFELNQNGVCSFDIGDTTIVLEAPADENVIILYSPLLPLTDIPNDAAYRRILVINYLCRDTAGATLAINDRAGTVCLNALENPDRFDYAAFKTWLVSFVDTASWLQNEIPARLVDTEPATPAAPPTAFFQPTAFA